MIRTVFFLILVIVPVLSNAELMECSDGSNGKLKKLYLKGKLAFKEETGKESDRYGIELGAKHTEFCITEYIVLSIAGSIYYKYSEIKLDSAENKTNTLGIGLGRLDYNKWTNENGVTPYVKINLEKSDTEKKDITGSSRVELSSIYAWGVGIEKELWKAITLDISYTVKLDNISDEKLFDETTIKLAVDFLKIL